ncbi:unnamed protein product [Amoebophrya sp. A25]|nr:unnamed protein product [Amoebophrya sp. A25]|eukprot:GSA25T00015788001.1
MLGGIRFRIFARRSKSRLQQMIYKKYIMYLRNDAKTGVFSVGIPYVSTVFVLMYVGTLIGDKQTEISYDRKQKVTQRELTLAQENDLLRHWMIETEKEYQNVPVPGGRGSQSLIEKGRQEEARHYGTEDTKT